MTRDLKFYKRDNRWFVDFPEYINAGGTEDECEMVAGADVWLDIISDYSDSITLKVSDEQSLKENLVLYEVLETGAVYVVQTYEFEVINKEMWLCPVTLFLFGHYPETIYYSKIK